MDVEQQGAAGVGHVRDVDSSVSAARQTLEERESSLTGGNKNLELEPAACCSYPDDPGVHGPKQGPLTQNRLPHRLHIVQQPTEFHSTEVSADGESGLMLPGESSRTHGRTNNRLTSVAP